MCVVLAGSSAMTNTDVEGMSYLGVLTAICPVQCS